MELFTDDPSKGLKSEVRGAPSRIPGARKDEDIRIFLISTIRQEIAQLR